MSNEARKALDQAYEKLMQMSLNQVPIDGLENLIHPDIMGWGTTLAEEVQSIEEYVALVKHQEKSAREQGLEFVFERDKIHEYFSANEKTALFVEKIHTTIKSDDIYNRFTFRFSVVMVLDDENWKLIHWHGSTPSDIEDDVWHVDEWKKEKERLEKLVTKKTIDLEKSNRELVIAASTEKVRAKSLAMQNSDELINVIKQLDSELLNLGVNQSGSVLMTDLDLENLDAGANIWVAVGDHTYLKKFHIPFKTGFSINDNYLESRQKNQTFYTESFSKEIKDEFFRYMFKHSDLSETPEERQQLVMNAPGYTRAVVSQENSGLFIQKYSDEPFTKEQQDIIKRFGNVFEQAYTRFLDLKKAEQQSYESKVETSLEKVRAMAANMNHSEDLVQIAEVMFEELEILKITPLRYGVGLIDGDSKKADLWVSAVNDGNHLKELGTVSLTMHPMLEKAFEAWENQLEELFYPLSGKELSNYYRGVTRINPDIPKNQVITDPNSGITQYCSFFPFRTGSLYAFTESEPDEHGVSVLKRFANVFEQAYTRFEDLQKTELQARLIHEERDRLEIALKELQATQEQLVQQEKLASLGQLTAGIAHEIKNPLNFVNNFSDLSVELIEETLEELNGISNSVSGEDQEKINEAIFILKDIDSNLKKIHEHGTRADSIVKSMLEHSRGGAGVMEPTDLNGLIKEFLNLSFHGMRAGKNSINVDIYSTLDNTIGKIPLIAEDFSRVIVNLCNNAFDAMREKQHADENFKAKLIVRTTRKEDKILIEIEDNGPGIPAEMKDKIMQPFFTTKKGTQGTGLGLSITNDIIKAHGGNLILKSKLGNGASFIIELPGNN